MKMNTENWIKRAREVHGDLYDYSKTVYKSSKDKVIITCPIHGDFEQTPGDHLRTQIPCPGCRGRTRTKPSLENFITRAKEVHGDYYDYSLVKEVKKVKDIVTIICPEHGPFEQEVNSHLQGRGCPICAGKKFDLNNFIKKANEVWNYKYDYSQTVYKGYGKPITIICPEHGPFEQLPNNHLKGECGCLQCQGKAEDFVKINTKEDFIQQAIKRFGDKFDYSKVNYVNSRTKITIICPEHGEFEILPYGFLHNVCGCPQCNVLRYARLTKYKASHGELLVESILQKYNIPYKIQLELIANEKIRLTNLIVVDFFVKYKGKQYFIEYNGRQHYEYIPFFHKGGVVDFEMQQKRDKWLRDFCELHKDKVSLLEIPYSTKDKDIEKLILDFINYN